MFLCAGCGGDDNEATPTETATVTTPVVTSDVRVYFLRDDKVWPVARQVPATKAVAGAALGALLAGPTDQETSDLKRKVVRGAIALAVLVAVLIGILVAVPGLHGVRVMRTRIGSAGPFGIDL